MAPYNPQEIEKKWQKKWLEEKVFKADDNSSKPKYYQLETFPYPSGAGLHVGHPKGYIAEDIHARYERMRGREVLYTMGWDAFGLPTENYAIKVGRSPQAVTLENTDNFRRQVRMFGFSYDWDREINTSTPEYYKWTQWIFIQLFKRGLAYRAKAKVNWCPKDQTIIANEQVINGLCDRCGSVIEERFMEQWMLRITDYAERLLSGLKGLDWPSATVKRQEDWIGKSEGSLIKFSLKDLEAKIEVFTTRPDTLFGTTYMVLAPEHPLVAQLKANITNWDEVAQYAMAASHKTDLMRQETVKEKTGVELRGVHAINPATHEEIPVWIADYVLGSYGTGAIMAVPAHDERDFEFAKKFGLPIRQVVMPHLFDNENPPKEGKENTTRNIVHCIVKHPTEDKVVALKAKKMDWLTPVTGGIEDGETPMDAALREIYEETGYKNIKFIKEYPWSFFAEFYAAHKDVNRAVVARVLLFELEDLKQDALSPEEAEKHEVTWIPYAEAGSFHPMAEAPFVAEWLRSGEHAFEGYGVLTNSAQFDSMDSETAKWKITESVGGTKKTQYKLRDWSVSRQRYWGAPIPMIHCEKCGVIPVPDADLPVVLPALENYRPQGVAPLASDPEFINVKCPQCGAPAKRDPETFDTFVDSSWYYLRYPDPHNSAAIFDKEKTKHWMPVDLYIIGAEHTVLHLLYSRFITKFLHDEGRLSFDEPFLKLRHQGLIRGVDGQKMSKSKGNVVNPDELIAEFGADTVRLYEMFMGPFEDGAPWDPKGILGVNRFLGRFWKYATGAMTDKKDTSIAASATTNSSASGALHRAIEKVGDDIEALKFNTAISALMILLNELEISAPLTQNELVMFVKLLHPFAPHMAQELWDRMGGTTYLDFEAWPEYDPKLIIEETVTLVFQVNGKIKDSVKVDAAITEEAAKTMTLENVKIKTALNGQLPKRIIYVDKKLVNIVI
jgi:leucyl-tRNA synthetase